MVFLIRLTAEKYVLDCMYILAVNLVKNTICCRWLVQEVRMIKYTSLAVCLSVKINTVKATFHHYSFFPLRGDTAKSYWAGSPSF